MRRSYSHMSGRYPGYPTAGQPYTGQPYAAQPPIHPNFSQLYYTNHPSQYNRKRQRRQAAAVVVQSLWNNNMGRKSTAQARPVLHVPPRGIGPIVEPNENDVLCGRGGRINSHGGNIQFRDVITAKKKEYLAPTTKKLEKAHIAASIVNDIRGMDPQGRFLKEDRDTGLWFDIGDAKAIKKTGQALREDAPDIRHEVDSSGDEKHEDGKDSPKKGEKSEAAPPKENKDAKPKSPKAGPSSTTKPAPQARQQGMVSGRGRGRQHVPSHPGAWQQGSADTMTHLDYQAQVAMPPPYSHQVNPYAGQQVSAQMMQNQNAFEARNIPIQAPTGRPPAIYTLPNQLVSGAKSVGQRMNAVSRQAMEVLSQSGKLPQGERNPNERPPEDVAFGRTFYAPPTQTVLSSDNTLSTISGLSDPLSSNIGIDAGAKGSAMSGVSGLSGFSGISGFSGLSPRGSHQAGAQRNSLRLSQIVGLGASGMGQSSRSQFAEAMRASKLSDMTSSVRSMGSLNRSYSLTDMNQFVDNDSWKAIMETDEEMHQDSLAQEGGSLRSGTSSGRFSVGWGRMGENARQSSAMSIASRSTVSSNRWLQGLKDSAMHDDGRSVLSEMSSDLHALDLAGATGFH
jgi:hypothetical protein